MTTSSVTPDTEQQAPALEDLAQALGGAVTQIEPLGGGRNSRVYKVWGPSVEPHVVKSYIAPQSDGRDRLATEWSSLEWLWGEGLRNIPRPIHANPRRHWAIYGYIEGEPVAMERVGRDDIDAAAEFLARLRAVRHDASTAQLPPASEACFSIRAIDAQLRQRLARLPLEEDGSPSRRLLCLWLAREFVPSMETIMRWCQERCAPSAVSWSEELPREERTLSPSDFGFHNAIRQRDGRLVFVDFEYFGWDDPAKTISDFLLHPAMALSEALTRYAAEQLLRRLSGGSGALTRRLALVYPLWGLKWCLICLNEFVPQDQFRRGFAAQGPSDDETARLTQLTKAQQMFHHILATYESFPYAS
jgi:hypothetical protein